MRLKRLRLSGFKSFCDDTVLNFDHGGVTMVVGPNGCGKSNVVDAIRWVLGEQSPSHLRGQAMGDVIFNGSEVRKPLGRSEVTIHFDNEHGGAPEKYRDYAEISVTRRLYRSGESEYLINKTPCRLMDIRDLVMDTGVAGRSYSIVEQGKVEEFITASPAERRIYMEEAAGIVRYKTKRIAAERKLEQTGLNLQRVHDLQGELHRQESQLRDQKDKAQQFLTLREQVNAMGGRLARARYLASARLCQELEQRREAIEQESIIQGQALDTVQARLEQLNLEQAQRETGLKESREAVHGRETELAEVRTGLELEKQNRDNCGEWIGRIDESLAEFGQRQETLAEELADGASELDTLRERDEAQGLEISRLETEFGDKEAGKAAIDAEIQSCREQLTACHTDLNGIGGQRQLIGERLADGARRQAGLETQAAATGEEREGVEAGLAQSRQAAAQLREEMEAGEERALTLGREIAAKSEAFEENQQAQIELEREIVEARSRMDSLREIEAGREGFEEPVRAVLQWAEGAEQIRREVGWLGPLADFIKVRPEVAEWAGDFLAPSLEIIAIREAAQLPLLQERLEEQGLGGVRIVALDAFPAPSAAEEDSSTMAGLVEFPPEFDGLRQGLYSTVRLHPAGALPHPLPTAEGCPEWLAEDGLFHIDHRGVVALGRSASPAAGILGRRAEITTLETRLEEFHGRQQKVRERVSELEAEAEALQNRLQEEESRRHEDTLGMSRLEQEQSHMEREAARLTQLMEHLQGESAQLKTAAEGYQQQQEEMETDAARLQAQQSEMETALAIAQEKSNVAALSVATLARQLTERKIEQQKTRSRLEHLDTSRAALETERQALEGKLGEGRQNLADQQNALAASQRKIEEITGSLAEMEKELAGKRQALLDDMARHEQQDSARAGLAHEAAEERRKQEHVRSKRHEVEVALAGERTRMEQWAEQSGGSPEDPTAELAGQEAAAKDEAVDDKALEAELAAARQRLEKMEGVNLAAPEEYEALAERLGFLHSQKEDLESAIADLEESIRRMNQESRRRFKETFDTVNEKFQEIFPLIFNGGEARLVLTDSEDMLLAGVDIEAQPPGKRLQNLNLLSGGEKALTAIALIFSFFLFKPSPFCLLDEVDAPLDDANVRRFTQLIQSMTDRSQFIIITHNKRTMEIGDLLYGVTMEEAGVSKIVSVNLAS